MVQHSRLEVKIMLTPTVLLTHYFDFKSAVLDHPTNVDIIEVDTYSAADTLF
jgi:hypothetical protein